MINMIRSINYSTRKNLVVVLTVISMICLPVFMVTVVMGASITEIDGAEYYCKMLGEAVRHTKSEVLGEAQDYTLDDINTSIDLDVSAFKRDHSGFYSLS